MIKLQLLLVLHRSAVAVSFTTVIGIGTNHTLSVPSDDATIRSIITIDNIIQSPVRYNNSNFSKHGIWY